MDMSKIKKMIIFLIILGIVVSIILAIIMLNTRKDESIVMPDEVGMKDDIELANTLQLVDIRNNYYLAKRCVERFYMYYSEVFKDPLEGDLIETEEGRTDTEQIKNKRIEILYNLLDKEYINYKEITQENIMTKLPRIEEVSIEIQDIYYIDKDENISAYFIYGKLKNVVNSSKQEFCIMLRLDRRNNAFKVLLSDYVAEHYNDIKVGKVVEFNSDAIEKNLYNILEHEHITDAEHIKELFKHYQNTLRESKEQSYNLLDERYKELCFENLEEYLLYLEEHYLKIVTGQVESYSKEYNNGYKQYLIKDTKDNYYILKETLPFKYTIMLDNYVITTEEFNEEYNKNSEAKKIVLNIKKFFKGIDDKNYGYSYSLLSDSFKNNKYPAKNDFINYAKENFFEKNEIEYERYEKENGVYIYEVKITDATGIRHEERTFNMIIKLKSGTDFEMSFGED